jgi:mannose/fructose/N-acetylgalactosamine-specific phosphotransferase system component IID/mannose/fructose/N-acetylgalactosamine-specific phosphotransferase system component IIC
MLQSILVGLISVIGLCDYLTGTSMIQRPVVLGALVGLVYGDLPTGVIMGSSIELIFMGQMSIGGAVPVVTLAGCVAVAIAMQSGAGLEAALALAVPFGVLYSMLDNLHYILVQVFVSGMDNAAKEGDYKKYERYHWYAFGLWSLLYFVSTVICVNLGSTLVENFFNSLPAWLMDGISAGTKLLPALGFAILLNSIWNKKIAAFFFIGFVLAAYLGLDTIAIAILGASVAVLYFTLGSTELPDFSAPADSKPMLTKKEINNMFWRAFTLEASYNYEKFQGTGFGYALIPALRKIYGDDKEALAEAMSRNCVMFQTTPQCAPINMGITLAMEEEYSRNRDTMDPASIGAVRSAFMGPLAGIGDSIFWGILRTVAAGVACSLGVQGNIAAPLVFLIIFNVPAVLTRYYGAHKSYELGMNFVSKLSQYNLLENLSIAAGIVGLMVIGGMTSSMVWVSTPLVITAGDMAISVQEFLDSLLPSMVPLLTVYIMSRLLKKNIKPVVLMISALVVGVLLTYIGVL